MVWWTRPRDRCRSDARWVMGRASRRENEPGPKAGSIGLCEIVSIVGARHRAVGHRKAGQASSHLVEGLVWLQQLEGPGAPSVGGSQQLPLGLPRPSPAPRAEAGAGPGAKRPYPEGGLRSRWRAGGLCRLAGRWWPRDPACFFPVGAYPRCLPDFCLYQGPLLTSLPPQTDWGVGG